jgi:hypothetical protein
LWLSLHLSVASQSEADIIIIIIIIIIMGQHRCTERRGSGGMKAGSFFSF